MKSATPILRMYDEAHTQAFYLDFLGFTCDWEHRFEPAAPLYMQVSQGDCLLHLSGHYGDASPGSAVRIAVPTLSDFCSQLRNKGYSHCRPGEPERMPWGTLEITLTDPSGNRLVLFEPEHPVTAS